MDDLTGPIFASHHQPLRVWLLCLDFRGLTLSNRQIARELSLDEDSTHDMTSQLRDGIVARQPAVVLSGEVECDEVDVVTGHKGHPEAVKKRRPPRCRRLKGAPGRGTLAKEKPPIFGMIQRGGMVVMRMLVNVKQVTISPLIKATIAPDTTVDTGEYDIDSHLPEWGDAHLTVNHNRGEYARDEDGDGFHEVHVNTMEGCWSPLRSSQRPQRGISQEKLPLHIALFEFVHHARKRGKALLESRIVTLLTPPPRNTV